MIYDYNSKLSSNEIDTIMKYDRELIEKLKKIRNTEETSAITTCSRERKHKANSCDALAETAVALLYRAQLWWYYTCSRRSFAKSDLLAFQLADFKNLIRDRKMISFYETRQTRQLEFV
jgi:hypothetical protein